MASVTAADVLCLSTTVSALTDEEFTELFLKNPESVRHLNVCCTDSPMDLKASAPLASISAKQLKIQMGKGRPESVVMLSYYEALESVANAATPPSFVSETLTDDVIAAVQTLVSILVRH
jgi:hypothetical protein